MITLKKGSFSLQPNGQPSSTRHEGEPETNNSPQTDYQSLGVQEAGRSGGEHLQFKLWLKCIYARTLKETHTLNEEERQRKLDVEKELEAIAGESSLLKQKKEAAEKEIEAHHHDIHVLETEVQRIKGGEKVSSEQNKEASSLSAFMMGGIIFIGLTAYLVIFYTSVIYSAFIYDVKAALIEGLRNREVFLPTIINLKALPKTHEEYGWLGSTFLIVSTSMFLALGYLIHQFAETKRHLRVAALLLFTLFFDVVLAYQIVEEIYIARFESGSISEPWSFSMVWTQVPFYIIIAAGFAVYIIWGLVLGFVLREKEKLSPRRVRLRECHSRIRFLKKEIATLRNHLKQLENDIITKESEWKQREKERHITIHDPKVIRERIHAFAIGWSNFLRQSQPMDQVNQIQQTVDAFISRILGEDGPLEPTDLKISYL